jgi:hypothetical protein
MGAALRAGQLMAFAGLVGQFFALAEIYRAHKAEADSLIKEYEEEYDAKYEAPK